MADSIYARIDENGYIEVRHQKPEKPAAPEVGRWIDDIPPAYDPATHRLEEKLPIPANAKKVPYKIVERDLVAEAEDHQAAEDAQFIQEMGPKTFACLLVELTTAIENAETVAVSVDDLSTPAKEAYRDLKGIVDRMEE